MRLVRDRRRPLPAQQGVPRAAEGRPAAHGVTCRTMLGRRTIGGSGTSAIRASRFMPLGVLLGCAALAVTGCGGDEAPGGADGATSGERVTVTVGAIPIADDAPLYLGMKKGFFEEQKLSVKTQLSEGGAASIPGLVNGALQFAAASGPNVLLAQTSDISLRVVALASTGGMTEDSAYPWGLLVKQGSQIRTPKDLEGRTVAVNTLKAINELLIRESLRKQGVDVSAVKFTEVPFPDMNSALENGRVDAVSQISPFLEAAEAQGARSLFNPAFVTKPGLDISYWITSERYLDANADVVRRFATAMAKANAYAQAHPEEVRQILTEYTKIPPQAIETIKLPTWSPSVNPQSLALADKLSVQFGFYEDSVDVEPLIPEFVDTSGR